MKGVQGKTEESLRKGAFISIENSSLPYTGYLKAVIAADKQKLATLDPESEEAKALEGEIAKTQETLDNMHNSEQPDAGI